MVGLGSLPRHQLLPKLPNPPNGDRDQPLSLALPYLGLAAFANMLLVPTDEDMAQSSPRFLLLLEGGRFRLGKGVPSSWAKHSL